VTVRITIDRGRCIGAGACLVAAPESFELDGSHRASLRIDAGHDRAAVRLAVESCPLGALGLIRESDAEGGPGVVAFTRD